MNEYKRETKESTVVYLHYETALQEVVHGGRATGLTQKRLAEDGYTKIVYAHDAKQAGRRLEYDGVRYRLSCVYVVPRAVYTDASSSMGEMILEHKPETRGQARVLLCIPLVSGASASSSVASLLHGQESNVDEVLGSYFSGSGVPLKDAWISEDETVVILKTGLAADVAMASFVDPTGGVDQGVRGIRKERVDGWADPFQGVSTSHVGQGRDILVQHMGVSGPTMSPSSVPVEGSASDLMSWLGMTEGFQEGMDIVSSMNAPNLGAGFGSFSSTVQQSGQTFNQAGDNYVFNMSKTNTTSSKPAVATTADYVDCVPIYDNADQVSTFVIPYGTQLSDDTTRLFMTSTFQMFYTLLVAFVILFLTPIMYKGYFAVAMRRGNADDPEYGNKITYSANLYFVLYSTLMVIGVIIDAIMYQQSTTELGFGIMVMVFFVCTYMFTLMLRSSGMDRTVYGDLQTKYRISEIMGLYAQFMQQYFSWMYSFFVPAAVVGFGVGISIAAYQNKSGGTGMPFGPMISLFFIGLFLNLSTMGTFFKKWQTMRAADATQM